VKGIGPKRAQVLHELGIETAADLLLNLPRRYLDRSNIAHIGELLEGQTVTVVGKVAMSGVIKGGKSRLEVVITDGTGELSLLWFAGWRFLQESLKRGVILAVSGAVTYFHGYQICTPSWRFSKTGTPRTSPIPVASSRCTRPVKPGAPPVSIHAGCGA